MGDLGGGCPLSRRAVDQARLPILLSSRRADPARAVCCVPVLMRAACLGSRATDTAADAPAPTMQGLAPEALRALGLRALDSEAAGALLALRI